MVILFRKILKENILNLQKKLKTQSIVFMPKILIFIIDNKIKVFNQLIENINI